MTSESITSWAKIQLFFLILVTWLALPATAQDAAGKGFARDGTEISYRTIPGASPVPREGAGLTTVEDLESFIDGFVAAQMEVRKVAGVTVSVVKDGELWFAKGYGHADIERGVPVDPKQTLFRPGSTSKLFTWTAVMQLVEQGKLDLDADVNQYITQFQIPATFPEPVTLRHIMTHTAGFEDGGLGYLMEASEEGLLPLAKALEDHMPERVRPVGHATAGISSSYSNWATALAGLIVANVSGMPFDEYVAEHIFRPLGMTSTTFAEPLPEDLAPRMSRGYMYENGIFVAKDFEFIHNFGPAGSMSTTAVDMANFMIAHLNDGALGDVRILGQETAQLMHSRIYSPNPHVAGSGLGFYEEYVNGHRLIGHGGDTLYFHTEMLLLPEANVGFFMSVNTGGEAASVPRDFVRAFMDRYFPAELPQLEAKADKAQDLARYAGTYRPTRHAYTTNDKLLTAMFSELKVAPTPEGRLVAAGLGEVHQYVEVAPGVFRRVDRDDILAFTTGEDGAVNGLVGVFSFMPFYKLAWYDTSSFHMVLVGVAVLFFVVAIVAMLRNWKRDRALERNGRLARRNLGLLAVVNIVTLALLALTFSGGIAELMFAWPASFKLALTLSLVAVALTIVALVLLFFVWRERHFSRWSRIWHTAGVVMAVAFLWFLNHWNLIGYKFG